MVGPAFLQDIPAPKCVYSYHCCCDVMRLMIIQFPDFFSLRIFSPENFQRFVSHRLRDCQTLYKTFLSINSEVVTDYSSFLTSLPPNVEKYWSLSMASLADPLVCSWHT